MATASKRAMTMATRVAGKDAGNCKGGKSNGDGAKRAIARKRAMVSVLCNWEYFGTYFGYLSMIPTSPLCDTFQLIPVSF
jgi:hypothetical protein